MSEKNGVDQQPPPQVDLDDVNGRLAELSELNSALTARAAGLRGQLAKKDREIQALTTELMGYRQREKEAAEKTSLSKKGPGNGEAHPK